MLGSVDLPDVADLAPGGTGAALSAVPAEIADASAFADTLAGLIGGDAATYVARLRAARTPTTSVVLGAPGDADTRTAIQDAIDDGRLAGLAVVDLPRIAVATADGLTFIDPAHGGRLEHDRLEGGAHGIGRVTGLDDAKLYVTTGTAHEPAYDVVTVGGRQREGRTARLGRHPLPGPVTPGRLRRRDPDGPRPRPDAGRRRRAGWTVYVIEPHANAVYADAVLPAGSSRRPGRWTSTRTYPTEDRQQILVVRGAGEVARDRRRLARLRLAPAGRHRRRR